MIRGRPFSLSAPSLWAPLWPSPAHRRPNSVVRRVIAEMCRVGERDVTSDTNHRQPCRYPGSMRIALVSPYSWTYQGGVNRHVEALAEQFISRGDHVRVLAPWDPPDAISRRLHRSHPELREAPDYLVPLGRTVGYGANGAVSNLSSFPGGPIALRRELRSGNYDVVHVHEPLAPLVGCGATP